MIIKHTFVLVYVEFASFMPPCILVRGSNILVCLQLYISDISDYWLGLYSCTMHLQEHTHGFSVPDKADFVVNEKMEQKLL